VYGTIPYFSETAPNSKCMDPFQHARTSQRFENAAKDGPLMCRKRYHWRIVSSMVYAIAMSSTMMSSVVHSPTSARKMVVIVIVIIAQLQLKKWEGNSGCYSLKTQQWQMLAISAGLRCARSDLPNQDGCIFFRIICRWGKRRYIIARENQEDCRATPKPCIYMMVIQHAGKVIK